MIVYLVRHTPVEIAKGICYGQSEVPVSSTYPADVRALKKKLKGVHFDTIISSPLDRCALLANDLANGSKVQIDQRLLELDFGDWELQPWDSINSTELRQWTDHFVTYPCPSGESFEDLRNRAASFSRSMFANNQDATILVITHGGVIRCLLAEVLGMPLDKAFNLQIDYSGVSCIESSSGNSTVLVINR